MSSTHLVKGLDWKLLERVKRGDGTAASLVPKDKESEEAAGSNIDEELESVLEKEVQAVGKEAKIKQGEMAPPPSEGSRGSQKRSRDEILQSLKASRTAKQRTRINSPGGGAVAGRKIQKAWVRGTNRRRNVSRK